MEFRTKLEIALEQRGSLCIGLDPDPDRMQTTDVGAWGIAIVEATADLVCAFKPNVAFYEAIGPERGYAALRRTLAAVPAGVVTIADAKRGDVPNTARAYARALFDDLGFDAATVNPYAGGDATAPWLERPEHGAFVLCRTSNPGASDVQDLDTGGRPLYEAVALAARRWDLFGNTGLVVGATYPGELARLRDLWPDAPFLVPGVGAQHGSIADCLAAGRSRLVISASRSVTYASTGADFAEAARAEASRLRAEMTAVV